MDQSVNNDEQKAQIELSFESSDVPEISAKAVRAEEEKKDILNRLVSGRIDNIRDRVAFVLNYSIESRNSDIELAWAYWSNFENDRFSGAYITKEQMKNLTRISSLSRMRAKIQNEYKLFQADDNVKRFRGVLEDDKRTEAIEDKPTGIGEYSVFIDETGKTQDYLSVGSLWKLKVNLSAITQATIKLQHWKKERQIDYEFHFNELTKAKLPMFKEFFLKFITLFPEAGFKLIVVNNKGFRDKEKAITDLTCHLLIKGIEHEHSTGRAPLPRVLQVWVDEEEKGSDQLKIENLKERLKSQQIDGLFFGEFAAASSKDSVYLQIVDLFTASINRKLHTPNGTNIKDEFADFVLGILKFDVSQINKQNSTIDSSTLFNLADIQSLKTEYQA